MTVVVDLPAVRAARHVQTVRDETIAEAIRDLRPYLRGARSEALPDGIRLTVALEPLVIAGLADEIRALGGIWPFLHLRMLAEPPTCCVEARGRSEAGEFARVVFGEIAT